MRVFLAGVATAIALAGAPAFAEVGAASPSSFQIQAAADVSATPDRVWAALGEIGRWWNDAHTYSGQASNMTMPLQAGACFCENWSELQSVEHGRVVLVMEHEGVRTLRFIGGLGPLQETGVVGVMTWTVAAASEGSTLTMRYRANGDAALGLEAMAPLVDQVLMEQFGRLVRYSETGAPA
ncbi:MAG: ATPase [Hyphomonadaceae bacterium]